MYYIKGLKDSLCTFLDAAARISRAQVPCFTCSWAGKVGLLGCHPAVRALKRRVVVDGPTH